MYGLAPEKLLRLVYEPFYLAISLTFYKTVKDAAGQKSLCVFPQKGLHEMDQFQRGTS